MKYLVKFSTRVKGQIVAIPANCESKDMQKSQVFMVDSEDDESVREGLRSAFTHGPVDEVLFERQGMWDNVIYAGRVKHPFLEDTYIYVPESR